MISEETVQEMSGLTHDFINAGTAQEGAVAFTGLVALERKIATMELTTAEHVRNVVGWLQPEGTTQMNAVKLAKLDMGFQP